MLSRLQTFFDKKKKDDREKFTANCKLIETNKNYTDCTNDVIVNKDLLSQVADSSGNALHTIRDLAIAFQASLTIPVKKGKCIGKLYHIRIANYGDYAGDEIPVWHIDSSKVIYVENSGSMAIHLLANIKNGIYNKPLEIPVEYFLNWNNPGQLPSAIVNSK